MSSAVELKIPAQVADLTPEWLTAALQPRFPGAVVERADLGRVINGTATKVRLLLEYNRRGHEYRLPSSLWVKAGFEAHSAESAPIYAAETRFYKYFSEELDIGCPQVFAAEVNERTGQSVLLFEDMLNRNAIFYDANSPLTPAQAGQVVRLLARLHSRYWLNPDKGGKAAELEAQPWLEEGGALVAHGIIEGVLAEENWSLAMSLPRGRHASGWLREREQVSDIMLRAVRRNREQAHCLIHGDAHVGNLCMSADGILRFIDWQTVMIGYWAHDIGEFMTSALTIADRRACEESLIRQYVDELVAHGVTDLSYDQAWLEYRKHAIYGFSWVLCPQVWQPESICEPTAERACAAILDLKTLEAWRE